MGSTEIAYQNKDITSKLLAENLKGKSFRVYGLDLPEIRHVLPTNIPTVKANELRLDNIFELADGTAAIVDYESAYSEGDKVKYLNYLAGIASRYQKEKEPCPKLRMVVIYTGDIKRKQVSMEYDIGAVKMSLECAFLSELDYKGIFQRLEQKIKRNERLDDGELMEVIVMPLSYQKAEEKQQKIRETVALAAQIQDRGQQLFALSGILAFTDKVIDRETANKIRRAIEMTQVAQIFEEEKQQALLQVTRIFEEEKQQALLQVTQIFEEEKQQALRKATEDFEEEKQQALEKTAKQIVVRMIKKDYSAEEIVSLVPSYSQNDVEALRRELNAAEEKHNTENPQDRA
ncbi:MAG: hypothetical protein HFH43_08465 [Lachnospiraceae bacterium]|nr:hypothetical protein [Lachnospiraceae bacterium]